MDGAESGADMEGTKEHAGRVKARRREFFNTEVAEDTEDEKAEEFMTGRAAW